MTRFVIYLFPALIDMALGCAMFVAAVRMSAVEGSSALAVTTLATIWAVTYMIVCGLLGLVVSSRNAAKLCVVGGVAIAATAGAFILIPAPKVMYVLMVPQAVSTALFFVPFQIFMKAVEGGHDAGVVRSTALYTASWSAGLGAGPFVAGWMMTFWDWRSCMVLNVVIGLVTAAGILLLRHHARAERRHEPAAALPVAEVATAAIQYTRTPNIEYARMPDLAWLGWVGSGAGFIVLSIIRSLLPKEGHELGIAEFNLGMILATVAWTHSLMGLVFLRSRTWMYRPVPVAALGLFGLAGMILFAVARHEAMFFVAAACFGVYSGAFSFYFVFHSLVHPEHSSRYISINEAVVGACSILGPVAGGLLADGFGFSTPYVFGAALVFAAVCLQAVVHGRHRREVAVAPAADGGER